MENKLYQLEILHEMTMSIGASLDLVKMLKQCMPVMMRRLDCTMASVIRISDGEPAPIYALPRNADVEAVLTMFKDGARPAETLFERDGRYYHLWDLPELGVLVLVRSKPLSAALCHEIAPIAVKLSIAIRACEQYSQLLALQQNLAESEERWKFALEGAGDGIWDWNPQTDEALFSKRWCEMLGYTEHEFPSTGAAWVEHLHPEDKAHVLAVLQEYFSGIQSIYAVEFRMRCKNGTWKWILARGKLIRRDADGNPLRLIGTHTDISKHKASEFALQGSNELLQSVIEHSPIRVFWKDSESRYLGCNSLFARDAGYDDPSQLLGKTDFDMGWHAQAEVYRADDRAVINSGVAKLSYEEVQSSPRGDTIWLNTSKVPLRDANEQVIGIVGIYEDITVRKEAEVALRSTANELVKANYQIEQERTLLAQRVEERTAQLHQVNQAKDVFLATMSHEIRTPLGGLLGMIELLGQSDLTAMQREQLSVAKFSGNSLLRIVNDILDWSKMEAGKLDIAPGVASVSEMLNSVASTYMQVAIEKGLKLDVELDAQLGSSHVFDSLRVSQILNNFLSNAIKFTHQGEIVLSTKRIAIRDDYETVCFSVRDTGQGIDDAHRARLFQHYEQASAGTARMYGGTGLGLAICRRLAELMDGNLAVDSTPTVGSTFSFTLALPLACSAVPVVQQPQQTLSVTPTRDNAIESLAGRAVLVVDDHPINRILLKQQIEQLGMHVQLAESGTPALTLWQTEHFDLVITDCHMPEMDGYELSRRIRALEQARGTARIPIIAWTANVLNEEEANTRAAGMDDLLTKPTNFEELKFKLCHWLMGEASQSVAAIAPLHEQLAVIDLAVLQRFVTGHAEQLEVLEMFVEQTRIDIAELRSTLLGEDIAACAKAAHRIKGACRMVGALALASLCERIEKAAKQGELGAARDLAGAALDQGIEGVALFRV
ncbi:MAG: PAS domain S-box protein [Gallionella sp.]